MVNSRDKCCLWQALLGLTRLRLGGPRFLPTRSGHTDINAWDYVCECGSETNPNETSRSNYLKSWKQLRVLCFPQLSWGWKQSPCEVTVSELLFSWAATRTITPIRLQPADEGPLSLSRYTKDKPGSIQKHSYWEKYVPLHCCTHRSLNSHIHN